MEWIEPEEPVDGESLRQALEIVVGTAHQNGVGVNQDWPLRHEDEPSWDVEIVRLANDPDGDD